MSTRDPAEIRAVFAQLRALPVDAETCVLMLLEAEVGVFDPRRLNPTEGLAAKFRAAARTFAERLANESTLVPYSAGRKPDAHEVVYLPTGDVEALAPLIETMTEVIDLPLFELDAPGSEKVRLYVVGLRLPNPGWILFLRAMSSKSRLRRSRKIAAFFSGGVFDELQEDPLLFDQEFDAVVIDNFVLVDDQRNFERALRFIERAREAAIATLTAVTANLKIQNRDEFFAAATRDINMIAKLRGIAEKLDQNANYAAAMTMENLLVFVRARPDLEIDIEGENDSEEFVFHPDPQRRWRLLKLLDDDFLHSDLTDTDYETNSKSVLGEA